MSALPVVALLAFPVFAIALFAMLGPVKGVIWTTLIGFLFLPEAFAIPALSPAVLPDYTKYTVIAYSLVFGLLAFGMRKTPEAAPPQTEDKLFRNIYVLLLGLALFSPFVTILDNGSLLVDGPRIRPGLGIRDAVSMLIETSFLLAALLVAWRWLATPERHVLLLTALMIMGLGYTFLVLFELRMSPQLNRWIYGYFPHSWVQHLRGGGYRPLVFLSHGLEVGFFLFMSVIACFALARQSLGRLSLIALIAGGWTLLVLLMSRNMGAAMIALMLSPVVLMLTVRIQIKVAATVAVLFLAFPAVRQAELINYDGFLSTISNISEQRAASMEFRLRNEDSLLQRAYEKPLFGWGGWARSQIFNDNGVLISVTDGIWVIVLGERGWVGYLGLFGLLCLPILWLLRSIRRKTVPPATVALAIIGAGNLIYMIPNATLTPVCMLVFGALAGFAQSQTATAGEQVAPVASDGDERTLSYSRFQPGTAQPHRRQVAKLNRRPGSATNRLRRDALGTQARFTRE